MLMQFDLSTAGSYTSQRGVALPWTRRPVAPQAQTHCGTDARRRGHSLGQCTRSDKPAAPLREGPNTAERNAWVGLRQSELVTPQRGRSRSIRYGSDAVGRTGWTLLRTYGGTRSFEHRPYWIGREGTASCMRSGPRVQACSVRRGSSGRRRR
ncbi:hypothetical protein OH77DRAFT_728772 [Trametes cingulata]|nr:hypothetical protein OH77DRAFT_728772 [Trametes cingulata]